MRKTFIARLAALMLAGGLAGCLSDGDGRVENPFPGQWRVVGEGEPYTFSDSLFWAQFNDSVVARGLDTSEMIDQEALSDLFLEVRSAFSCTDPQCDSVIWTGKSYRIYTETLEIHVSTQRTTVAYAFADTFTYRMDRNRIYTKPVLHGLDSLLNGGSTASRPWSLNAAGDTLRIGIPAEALPLVRSDDILPSPIAPPMGPQARP
jgi:hypothetical protein